MSDTQKKPKKIETWEIQSGTESLDLQFQDGTRFGIPYIHLYSASGNSEVIIVDYPSTKITVIGEGLDDLYIGIIQKRISVIREKPPITSIKCEEKLGF